MNEYLEILVKIQEVKNSEKLIYKLKISALEGLKDRLLLVKKHLIALKHQDNINEQIKEFFPLNNDKSIQINNSHHRENLKNENYSKSSLIKTQNKINSYLFKEKSVCKILKSKLEVLYFFYYFYDYF